MKNSLPYLNEIAHRVVENARTDVERAVKIHDYVRDNLRYGFTNKFDEASPMETLSAGVGHCNPQTTLFVSMLRAVGIEARYHFVTLSGEILRGVLPNPPSEISHGFAEVRLNGKWLKVDSYIVDPDHAAGALARLEREGRDVGYGIHSKGRVTWDGRSDSFSQFADSKMMIEDQGTWEEAEDFFASRGFRHRIGPFSFSSLFRTIPATFFSVFGVFVESRINRLRAEASAQPALVAA